MSARHLRVLPLVIAAPLFLQNVDTSVMATALPTIANSLHVGVLDLNLAITSYLLSLAVFLPASAWLADRFGAKRLFCAAVLMFSAGSALCGFAGDLRQLVFYRLLQGVGGALMVPVARTILLRSVPAADLVRAMVWFTVPGALGRLAGPLFGGAIVSVASWRWIFFVNIPFGLLGFGLAAWLVERDERQEEGERASFDLVGLLLLAAALTGLLGGMETMGKGVFGDAAIVAMILLGALALGVYLHRSRRMAHPILDFSVLRHEAYRITVIGGFPIRVMVGAGPFMLPLLFQVGFGMSPIASGVLTIATAAGALSTRGLMMRTIRAIGFRKVLIVAATAAGFFYIVYGQFTARLPPALMFGVLAVGGLFTSAALVALSTLGYTGISRERTGHATALATMSQQLATAVGVVLGAALLSFFSFVHGNPVGHLQAADFAPAFASVGLLGFVSANALRRLSPSEGDEMRGTQSG